MKVIISLAVSLLIASSISVRAADAAANWSQHCASCHGKDGSGSTTMGKKLGVKDYTKVQGFSDAEATKAIKSGSGKMKAYGDKLADADIKALVAYVRGLKK
jgi:cytochrome c oxidase cbb3-type subunit 3